jgi:hypothetical protein
MVVPLDTDLIFEPDFGVTIISGGDRRLLWAAWNSKVEPDP